MAMNLNDELANLAVSYRGLAEQADREAADREAARERAPEYGQSPANLPDPADSQRVAAYWRFHEKTAKDGFLYYEDPPPGSDRPQTAIPSYHQVTTAAIQANRIRYGSASDAWKLTDTERPRAPEAKPAPVPTEPSAAWRPTAGAKQVPSSPPPIRERGAGEFNTQFSKKDAKVLKRLAKETRRGY